MVTPESSSAPRRGARLAGLLVTLACLGFVAVRIAKTEASLWRALLDPAGIVVLGLVSVAYAGVCLSLVAAWRRLLRWLGERVTFPLALSIYGCSQLAKYLPGNVFHLAGRQFLAVRAGIAATAAAAATIFEHTGLLAAACGVTLVAFPLALVGNPWLSTSGAVLLFLGMLLAPFVLSRLSERFRLPRISRRQTIVAWLPVYGHYVFFMLAAGGLTWVIAHGLTDSATPWIFGAFAPAWIAGLITPGAPSGLGVREAVLIFILGPLMGESESTLVALVLRLATTIGDLLFFALGHLASLEKDRIPS